MAADGGGDGLEVAFVGADNEVVSAHGSLDHAGVHDAGGRGGELAGQGRAKNAGPFWIPLGVFFKNESDYQLVTNSTALSKQAIGRLYQVDPATAKFLELP